MQTLIVGDIHGCYEELRDLLDVAGLAVGDRIVVLGDFLDRGPDSVRVHDFLQETPGASALMGNHERKHARSFRGLCPPAFSQVVTRLQFGGRYAEVCNHLEVLPLFLDLPEALLVHGYWEPGIALEGQHESVLAGVMSGESRLRALPAPWYELYDGPKPIVVGHQDYRKGEGPLIIEGRVYGLDTGCCRGGRLTGLLLPSFEVISVPSRDNHWAGTVRRFGHLHPKKKVRLSPRWGELETCIGELTALECPTPNQVETLRGLQDAYARGEQALAAIERHLGAAGGPPCLEGLRGLVRGDGQARDRLRRHLRHPSRAVALVGQAGPAEDGVPPCRYG